MSGASRLYNIIAIVFLILSILACIGVVAWVVSTPAPPAAAVAIPTQIVLPTLTPSATLTATPRATNTPLPTFTLVPSITPLPSATPITPTATLTLTTTPTPLPTITITNTPGPTPTSTVTLTATNTDIPTALPSPTGPTPSPFPFQLRGNQVQYLANFANTAGCAWQGIGGQVFDVNGNPLDGIQVAVYNQSFNQITQSGTNSFYGAGGWEVTVGTAAAPQQFIVELRSQLGVTISNPVNVSFPGDCGQNVAVVNFDQTRPF
jgi:hypothetical protein